MNISSSYVTSHENYGSGGCNYGTFYGSFPLSIRETFEQWHFPYDGVFFKKVWVTSFFYHSMDNLEGEECTNLQ